MAVIFHLLSTGQRTARSQILCRAFYLQVIALAESREGQDGLTRIYSYHMTRSELIVKLVDAGES